MPSPQCSFFLKRGFSNFDPILKSIDSFVVYYLFMYIPVLTYNIGGKLWSVASKEGWYARFSQKSVSKSHRSWLKNAAQSPFSPGCDGNWVGDCIPSRCIESRKRSIVCVALDIKA